MKSKVMVIAAHPDDEILGVGGTLVKHVKHGDEIFCLILGEGLASRDNTTKEELEKLHQCCQSAGRMIGFKEISILKLPDNQFDSIPLLSLVKEVERFLERIKPDIVYTHHSGDVNLDHHLTCEAVITACRPCNPNAPKKIYAFETLSSSEWQLNQEKNFFPNIFIGIKDEIDTKIKAFKEYQNEIRQYPHPRSTEGIKILAQFRGLQSGLEYVEAFCLLREIKK